MIVFAGANHVPENVGSTAVGTVNVPDVGNRRNAR